MVGYKSCHFGLFNAWSEVNAETARVESIPRLRQQAASLQSTCCALHLLGPVITQLPMSLRVTSKHENTPLSPTPLPLFPLPGEREEGKGVRGRGLLDMLRMRLDPRDRVQAPLRDLQSPRLCRGIITLGSVN